jgi:hypothetical protein
MSWNSFQEQQPELATFGAGRLNGKIAYLATIRKDGSPRVHPVTPIVGEGHLFVFMEPTSPKGHDLVRDPRFAIHSSVSDNTGGEGEFIITGRAFRIDNPDLREMAVRLASYKPVERYILLGFNIDSAASTIYRNDEVVRRSWTQSMKRYSG